MDFSEKLVNKIHTHRINPVIVFILFSITMALLIPAFSNGLVFDIVTVSLISLAIGMLFIAWVSSRIVKTNNFELGKLEDFVILNSNLINESTEYHKDILSIITKFDTSTHVINSEIIIKKFQSYLDD